LVASDKTVSVGRVKADDARLVYRTKFSSVDELVERLAPAIYEWGLLVRDNPEHENGDQLQFAILLGDGTPAVRARAKVKKSDKLPEGRMALKFTALDAASKDIWDRMLASKHEKASAPVTTSTPETIEKAEPAAAEPDAAPASGSQSQPDMNQRFDPTPAPTPTPTPTLTPTPTPAPTPAPREDEPQAASISVVQSPVGKNTLDDSLRRMVLVDEDAEVVPVVAPEIVEEKQDKKGGVVLGIDLGTTNSCCAMVKGDRPFVIPSRRGHNTIPSVVAINAMGEVLVGSAAKAQLEINPERTIYGSKRLVGRPFDSPLVRLVRDRFHYNIVEGPNNEAAVQIDDRILNLEEVASLILTELRDTAQDYLGNYIERAVITVPAFYNENQRQAVRRAGEMAGFQVERIINEPTAAALTFGVKSDVDRRMLVYDLGGGTFDASVLELKGDVYEVLSTGGDTFLGGVDFDAQLMDHILIEFQLDLGKMPDLDRVAYLRVLQGAEFVKRSLSSKNEAQLRLPFIGRIDGNPVDLDVTVTRETLDSLVGPMVQRTLDVCESILAQRSLKPEDLDDILLVGGQTRMPLIRQRLQELFGKEPLKGVHPDEAVATGAALLGHSLDQETKYKLIDVLPISIGVGVPGGVFRKVITAGTGLPAARAYGLYTYVDNQTNMVIPIYQGESNKVDESEMLGVIELAGIPPAPAGKRMIEITFALTPECLLSVTAKDRDGGKLADVKMSAQDSIDSLLRKLAAVPEKAAQADLVAEDPEPADAVDSGKKRGFWGWVKGLFGR
jgi:molecular chaperone DnaK